MEYYSDPLREEVAKNIEYLGELEYDLLGIFGIQEFHSCEQRFSLPDAYAYACAGNQARCNFGLNLGMSCLARRHSGYKG